MTLRAGAARALVMAVLVAACAAHRAEVPAPRDTQAANAPRPAPAPSPDRPPFPAPLPETPPRAAASTPPAGTLLVVARDTGAVVPHATVALRATSEPYGLRDGDAAVDLIAILGRDGQLLEADDDGRVELPAFGPYADVAARGDGRGGGTSIRLADGPEWTVVVSREVAVRVRVVDADGTPLPAVLVALAATGFADSKHVVARALTGPDGVATFAGVRPAESAWLRRDPQVGFPFPGIDSPWVAVDLTAPQADPIELRLPESGGLRVEIRDESDAAATGMYVVTLDVLRDWDGPPLVEIEGRAGWRRETATGSALFSAVGIGSRLRVTAEPADHSREPETVVVDGPTEAAATAVARVQAGPRRRIVIGRLVAADDGAGLPRRRLKARLLFPGDIWRGLAGCDAFATTDANGAFRVVLPGLTRNGHGPTLQLALTSEDRSHAAPRVIAARSLPPRPGAAPFDLGTLAVPTARLLVAGVVFGADGRPLGDATVAVVERVDGVRKAVRRGGEGGTVETTTDESGVFRLYGRSDAPEVELEVTAAGHFRDVPFTAPIGTADACVQMKRAGRIRGYLLLPAAMSRESGDVAWPSVAVHAADDGGSEFGGPIGEVGPYGSFEIDCVPPGLATVRVTGGLERATVRVIENVRVTAGESTDDERLTGIDLRGVLHRTRLEILDHRGPLVGRRWRRVRADDRARDRPLVFVRPEGMSGWRPATILGGVCGVCSTCESWTLAEEVDVLVLAEDNAPARVHVRHGTRFVYLEVLRWSTVTFHLSETVDLPAAPARLEVTLLPVDGESAERADPRNVGEIWFGPTHVFERTAVPPGAYRVELTLVTYSGSRVVSAHAIRTTTPDRVLDVSGDESARDVEITPDPAALARALEESARAPD